MRAQRLLFLFATIGIGGLTTSSPDAAQRDRHPEADEYIKLGTRQPPLPPGEGGQLLVSAPAEYCRNSSFILTVNLILPGFSGGPVAKVVAGPSGCRWQFDDLPPGDYLGNLTYIGQPATPADDRIVATGRVQLAKAAAASLVLAPPETEVEGTLRINGAVPSGPVHLIFRSSRRSWLEWDAPLDAKGAYRVAIAATEPNEQICVHLQREPPINSVFVRCPKLGAGLQQLDIDAKMPRGVLRIDIPPVAKAAFGAFARITISDSDDAERGYLTSFKLIRGLQGDYITDIDHDYRIIVTSYEDKSVLASTRVPLTAERPDARVRLPLTVR